MTRLAIPGPTPVPERVLQAAARPMLNHRGPDFAPLLADCVSGVAWALETRNDVLLFPGSGTAGLEAAVANLLSPGERALFCTAGAFGERWAAMAEAFGADVARLSVPWGEAITAPALERALANEPRAEKVFLVDNETSTGATTDLAAVAAVAKTAGRLVVVDSISAAGCVPIRMDELGLDVVITASQKGWLAPPGLVMLATSAPALAAAAEATCPCWYFDLERERKFQSAGETYVTPPLSVMYALREGLALMREEGLAAIWERHRRVAAVIRDEVSRLGLDLFAAAAHRSDTVTAVRSPFASAGELAAFLTSLRDDHELELAGGQEQLRGRIFRIGHMGMVSADDAAGIVTTLETALRGAAATGHG